MIVDFPILAHRIKIMYAHVNPKNMQPSPLVADDVYKIIIDVSGRRTH